MRFGKRAERMRVMAVEITSMIDVVFLLIIFFMTTARFAQETRADLELPQERGEQQETPEEAGLIVNLTADGMIIVSGHELTLADLDRIVNDEIARTKGGKAESVKLMIRADRNASTAHLNQVVSRLQELGVGAARVATEVP